MTQNMCLYKKCYIPVTAFMEVGTLNFCQKIAREISAKGDTVIIIKHKKTGRIMVKRSEGKKEVYVSGGNAFLRLSASEFFYPATKAFDKIRPYCEIYEIYEGGECR